MQRTSRWGMPLPCLSRRLVWRCGCFQLLYSGFAHFVFEKKKEEEITAGGLYPWTIPIAITMATCARNCSYCRRQRMYSSTGSIPFAVSQIIIQRKAIGVIKLLTLPWHWSSYDWRSSGMILCTIWSSLARRLFPTTLFVINSNVSTANIMHTVLLWHLFPLMETVSSPQKLELLFSSCWFELMFKNNADQVSQKYRSWGIKQRTDEKLHTAAFLLQTDDEEK